MQYKINLVIDVLEVVADSLVNHSDDVLEQAMRQTLAIAPLPVRDASVFDIEVVR